MCLNVLVLTTLPQVLVRLLPVAAVVSVLFLLEFSDKQSGGRLEGTIKHIAVLVQTLEYLKLVIYSTGSSPLAFKKILDYLGTARHP